jgi:uncharacterized membrane protein YfcA
MTFLQVAALFAAAMLAGALNSVAGGGSFISFPTLISVGVDPKIANATNTVALWPGSVASVGAYRRELTSQRAVLIPLSIASLVGGVFGAVLLIATPEATFKGLLPWLMLFATLLFTFGSPITRRLRERNTRVALSPRYTQGIVIVLQFITAVYGGFFGGGIGIVMLATLSIMGMTNIHEMNGLKTLLATLINGIASLIFIIKGLISWPHALLMIVGAIVGGYFGAFYARKIDPRLIRYFVIAVGIFMTYHFFTTP